MLLGPIYRAALMSALFTAERNNPVPVGPTPGLIMSEVVTITQLRVVVIGALRLCPTVGMLETKLNASTASQFWNRLSMNGDCGKMLLKAPVLNSWVICVVPGIPLGKTPTQ